MWLLLGRKRLEWCFSPTAKKCARGISVLFAFVLFWSDSGRPCGFLFFFSLRGWICVQTWNRLHCDGKLLHECWNNTSSFTYVDFACATPLVSAWHMLLFSASAANMRRAHFEGDCFQTVSRLHKFNRVSSPVTQRRLTWVWWRWQTAYYMYCLSKHHQAIGWGKKQEKNTHTDRNECCNIVGRDCTFNELHSGLREKCCAWRSAARDFFAVSRVGRCCKESNPHCLCLLWLCCSWQTNTTSLPPPPQSPRNYQ